MATGRAGDAGDELARRISSTGSVKGRKQAPIRVTLASPPATRDVATCKSGSKVAVVGDQLVLTIAVDEGGVVNMPRSERTVTIPLGRAKVRTDQSGNAWVYDGAALVETLEACQPLQSLMEIARKVMAVAVNEGVH